MCDRPHSSRDARRVDCTTGSVAPQERFPNVMCIVFVSSPPCNISAGGPLVHIFYLSPSPAPNLVKVSSLPVCSRNVQHGQEFHARGQYMCDTSICLAESQLLCLISRAHSPFPSPHHLDTFRRSLLKIKKCFQLETHEKR